MPKELAITIDEDEDEVRTARIAKTTKAMGVTGMVETTKVARTIGTTRTMSTAKTKKRMATVTNFSRPWRLIWGLAPYE